MMTWCGGDGAQVDHPGRGSARLGATDKIGAQGGGARSPGAIIRLRGLRRLPHLCRPTELITALKAHGLTPGPA